MDLLLIVLGFIAGIVVVAVLFRNELVASDHLADAVRSDDLDEQQAHIIQALNALRRK
jgi:hypothetical protein